MIFNSSHYPWDGKIMAQPQQHDASGTEWLQRHRTLSNAPLPVEEMTRTKVWTKMIIDDFTACDRLLSQTEREFYLGHLPSIKTRTKLPAYLNNDSRIRTKIGGWPKSSHLSVKTAAFYLRGSTNVLLSDAPNMDLPWLCPMCLLEQQDLKQGSQNESCSAQCSTHSDWIVMTLVEMKIILGTKAFFPRLEKKIMHTVSLDMQPLGKWMEICILKKHTFLLIFNC